ncbi:hypothetical protein HYH03_001988 [Edaphochlamys debaryana]|uniref:Uncharacterized protein n=1 Tax=Edaphochlamys debaryana TaxID=47281 RepID=A0A835YMJ4_9CHLO|nr:hypothetical protein HYH03_001988 [Edaphochlamys debaryana]|eukprot:KAG2500419.1 hypothetical protein HYH03_001988 [Edaphochlamys debaryana]
MMDRVMVRVSSGKGALSSRFSGGRVAAVASAQASNAPSAFSFQSFLYLLMALCGVFLVAHFIFTASESSRALRSTLRSVPNEAILQAQLLDKEREIEKLKWEIDQIRNGVNLKTQDISKREDVISQLQAKAALEHDAKTKAELALTERAGALHECQEQKTALAGEVAQCHFDLKALLSGESHRVSQRSAAALNSMNNIAQNQGQFVGEGDSEQSDGRQAYRRRRRL